MADRAATAPTHNIHIQTHTLALIQTSTRVLRWYYFNDQNVSTADERNAHSKHAYMLFFERRGSSAR